MRRESGGRGQQNQVDVNGPMLRMKHNGREQVNFLECRDRKADDPVFNVVGNVTGMSHDKSPVSNMRMFYQTRKGAAPELNFDIDLTKEGGEDEKFVLSNEPSAEEKESRVREKLDRLECELEDVRNQLAFVKRLRMEWNAQKVGLCNRRLKDNPQCHLNGNK